MVLLPMIRRFISRLVPAAVRNGLAIGALLAGMTAAAHAQSYDICNSNDYLKVLILAQGMGISSMPTQITAGSTITVQGFGFNNIPPNDPNVYAMFVAFVPVPGTGLLTSVITESHSGAVLSDSKLVVDVPADFNTNGQATSGMFVLTYADTCTWASAGKLVTGTRSIPLLTKRSLSFLPKAGMSAPTPQELGNASLTVVDQTPGSPLSATSSTNRFAATGIGAYFDGNANGILDQEPADASGATGVFPRFFQPVPPTPTSPPWVVRRGNRFAALR